ncbi:CBO0543 family protein [Bacillus sp. B15-48]|uniref:CBO0543 family protein n=1 Tax=Bacillus sp. B15-48 TaxID=1548601 RepID=UPI001940093C|nr:CBO0543 family protein [Bacillus sp. B15-48]MBM4761787.1 hypothetical protein [Bacillus sp. B15-48]
MIETYIEYLSWAIGMFLFFCFVPKSKIQQAIIGILVMQLLTWPLGLIVVELNLITYPVRFFDDATKASFTFEYFIFPIVSGLFNIHYPKNQSVWKVFIYTSVIVSLLTIGEVLLEIFTNNIEYVNWHWYWSWLSMFAVLHLSYRIYRFVILLRA